MYHILTDRQTDRQTDSGLGRLSSVDLNRYGFITDPQGLSAGFRAYAKCNTADVLSERFSRIAHIFAGELARAAVQVSGARFARAAVQVSGARFSRAAVQVSGARLSHTANLMIFKPSEG